MPLWTGIEALPIRMILESPNSNEEARSTPASKTELSKTHPKKEGRVKDGRSFQPSTLSLADPSQEDTVPSLADGTTSVDVYVETDGIISVLSKLNNITIGDDCIELTNLPTERPERDKDGNCESIQGLKWNRDSDLVEGDYQQNKSLELVKDAIHYRGLEVVEQLSPVEIAGFSPTKRVIACIRGLSPRIEGSKTQMRPIEEPAGKGKHIRFTSIACLLDAAIEGDLAEVKKLIEEERIHPDSCNADGVTALHCAVGTGRLDLIQYLLEHGASVNVPDEHGWTPLHSATYGNHKDIVELLLKYNADVEVEDCQALAPLGLPTDPELIKMLTKVSQRKNLGTVVTAMYDLDSNTIENGQGEELSFNKGDTFKILNRDDSTWWLVERDGEKGYIPRQFVQ